MSLYEEYKKEKAKFLEETALAKVREDVSESFLHNFPAKNFTTPDRPLIDAVVGFTEDYKPVYSKEIGYFSGKNPDLKLPDELYAYVSAYLNMDSNKLYYVGGFEGIYEYFSVISHVSRKNVATKEEGDCYTASCYIDMYGLTEDSDTIVLPSFRIQEQYDDLDTLKDVLEQAGAQIHEQVTKWASTHPEEIAAARQRWINDSR